MNELISALETIALGTSDELTREQLRSVIAAIKGEEFSTTELRSIENTNIEKIEKENERKNRELR